MGHSEEGGERSTWDRLLWMFGCWRGTCLVANSVFLHRNGPTVLCCPLHSSFKEWEQETGCQNKAFAVFQRTYRSPAAIYFFICCIVKQTQQSCHTAKQHEWRDLNLTRSCVAFGFNKLQRGLQGMPCILCNKYPTFSFDWIFTLQSNISLFYVVALHRLGN